MTVWRETTHAGGSSLSPDAVMAASATRAADGEAEMPAAEGAVGLAQSAAPVKKLAGSAEAPVIVEKPKEAHEYAGEFYPVDRGAKKKTE